jgi:transcriptional regulator with XRE-family HTH domain
MTLHALAERSGVGYTPLSRLEADSTTPGPDTVAKICEAVDGDLRTMLELADCLPRLILDRIESRQAREGPVLNRAFHDPSAPADTRRQDLAELLASAGLDQQEESEVMTAITQLLALTKGRREAVASLIATLYAEGHESST